MKRRNLLMSLGGLITTPLMAHVGSNTEIISNQETSVIIQHDYLVYEDEHGRLLTFKAGGNSLSFSRSDGYKRIFPLPNFSFGNLCVSFHSVSNELLSDNHPYWLWLQYRRVLPSQEQE